MKNLIITAVLFASFLGYAQELENELKIDGKTYVVDTNLEKAIILTKDRYDNWNLLATIKSDGKSIAFNIATAQEKLASGSYPLMNRVKKIETGKVGFSMNVIDDKAGGMAYLTMKQYSSTDSGGATVSNENGLYSITFDGVKAINVKGQSFILNGNVTLNPLEFKTRKELNKENKDANMSAAFSNEVKYFNLQAKKIEKLITIYKEDSGSENLNKVKAVANKLTECNEEIINILSRPNDNSISESSIKRELEVSSRLSEQLKNLKKEVSSANLSMILNAFEYVFKDKI
jgi:hypothetical protein